MQIGNRVLFKVIETIEQGLKKKYILLIIVDKSISYNIKSNDIYFYILFIFLFGL